MCNEREKAFLDYLKTRKELILVGEYINSRTSVPFLCTICGHRWKNTPGNIKNNLNGCPNCARCNNQREKNEKAKRKFEAYIESVGTLTIKSEYINTRTKVRMLCSVCLNEFNILPGDLLSGQKCSFCNDNKRNEKNKNKLLKRIKSKRIELIGEFIGLLVDTEFKCRDCGTVWSTRPDVIINSLYLCPKCTDSSILKNYQSYKNDFVRYISSRSDIELIGEMINSRVQVHMKCKDCGHEWFVIPKNLQLKNSGCKPCQNKTGHNKRTSAAKEKFMEHLKTRPIKMIGDITRMSQKTTFKCDCCNHTWDTTPNMLITNQSGCPGCAASNRAQILVQTAKISFLKYLRTRKDMHMVSEFVDMGTKIKFQCTLCSKEWEQSPNRIKFIECGCPYCNASKGEKAIGYFLDENQVPYIFQWSDHNCIYKYPLRFDFYLPGHNLVIEFQGIQHYEFSPYFFDTYEEFEQQLLKDEYKREYCSKNDIRLLEIPYYEMDQISEILNKELSLY